MAHYDCKDCGASMGIEYGLCDSCTPKEVFEAQRKLSEARKVAERSWKASPLAIEYVRRLQQVEEEQAQARDNFINPLVESARRTYQDLYNKYAPRNRRK